MIVTSSSYDDCQPFSLAPPSWTLDGSACRIGKHDRNRQNLEANKGMMTMVRVEIADSFTHRYVLIMRAKGE